MIATKAPAIQKLEHWTLVTNDVDRSRQFYTEIMGGQPPARVGGPVSVNLAGTVIDLFPAHPGWEPSPGSGGQHHAYIIELEDYDPWVSHLRSCGVEPRMTTHGVHRMSIYVDDPDGYHLELTVPFDDAETGKREIAKRGLTPDGR